MISPRSKRWCGKFTLSPGWKSHSGFPVSVAGIVVIQNPRCISSTASAIGLKR